MAVKRTVTIEGFGYTTNWPTEFSPVFDALIDLRIRQFRDMSEPLREFGEFLIQEHIPHQIDAGGTPNKYASLSPAYAAWKALKYPGMPILVLSGAMLGAFYALVEAGNALSIVNQKDYAKYHMTGTRKMPARPWLQLKNDDWGWEMFREIVRHWLVRSAAAEIRASIGGT